MAKSRHNDRFLIISVVVILGFIIMVFSLINKGGINNSVSSFPSPTLVSDQTYTSADANLSIIVPSGYRAEEKFNDVTLTGLYGKIEISRIATDFENIEDYFGDLSLKNKIQIENKTISKINGYDYIRGIIKTPQYTELIYFVFAEGWIYNVYTRSENLYEDLDRVAQSFKYIR